MFLVNFDMYILTALGLGDLLRAGGGDRDLEWDFLLHDLLLLLDPLLDDESALLLRLRDLEERERDLERDL